MIRLWIGVVLGFLIYHTRTQAQRINDHALQMELNREFAAAGVDSFDPSTSRAKHTTFVGSNPKAQRLGDAYQWRRSVSFGAARRRTRTRAGELNRERENFWIAILNLPEVGECDDKQFNCNKKSQFRTIDGSCNNLENPTWGKSFIQMRRFLPPRYDDGISSPRMTGVDGSPLPSARVVSTTVHESDDGVPKLREITNMLMQWGQFLDHDITLAPVQTGMDGRPLTCCPEDVPANLRSRLNPSERSGCFPIEIPPDDPRFTDRRCMQFPRSIQVNNVNCSGVPAEQLNQLTAYVDASNVYGSDEEEAKILRTFEFGLLKISENDLLPLNNDTLEVCTARCLRAGDERSNEQIGLTSIHTVFLREHNRIARTLYKLNPEWNDERLYQETRKILGAIMQKITYTDFLPLVLNTETLFRYELGTSPIGFNNVYDKKVDASIRNSFAAAAYRFGHSLLRTLFSRLRPNFSERKVERLRDLFGNTKLLFDTNGDAVDELMRGKLLDRASRMDRFMTPEVTNFLFATLNDSLDLAALNIQRGRDHGVPAYTAWREWCGLSKVTNFNTGPGGLVDHHPYAARQLQRAYRNPQDIDLFAGGLSELPLEGGLVGPTFSCILATQFSLLKKGDRFWFETDDVFIRFTQDQLNEIRKSSLSRIICDNTDTFFLQANAFKVISRFNELRHCHQLPRVNLYAWQLGGTWGQWSSWSGCGYGAHVKTRTRACYSLKSKCKGPNIEQSRCNYYVHYRG